MNILKVNSDSYIDNYIISDINELKVNNVERLYYCKYNDSIIEIYGCLDSNNGILNTHKLPPNGMSNALDIESNNIEVYGNIYIIKLINNILHNYNIAEYGEFFSYLTDYYDYERNTSESDDNYNEIDDINEKGKNNTIYHKVTNKKIPLEQYELELDTNTY